MSVETRVNRTKNPISLTVTLTIAFIILSVVPLLILGGWATVRNFQVQQQVAASQERQNAQRAANQVSNFLEQVVGTLEAVAIVEHPFSGTLEEQRLLLENLIGAQPAFRQVALLDVRGQELVKQSRLHVITPDDLTNRANSDLFIQATQDVNYLGSVFIDETTSEPLITIGVPVKNAFGEFQGVLVADVNLKFMWDLVSALRIGTNGRAYVVDKQGNLIAFDDTSAVLRGENVVNLSPVTQFVNDPIGTNSSFAQLSTGINGNLVLSTYVPLGRPNWAIVVELPIAEAYQALIRETVWSALGVLVITALAGVAGVYVSRRLAAPVQNLTETATRIAGGEINLEASLEGTAEVSTLAKAFNSMTDQLRELIQSLEDRVAARTQRLELVASLSEQLAAILDFDQLLIGLVNRVKTDFNYYHAHVYILDDSHQNLVMTAGAGEPGEMMKAKGHSIRLDAPTSLVARAARTGQIVWVDNVREAEDWLPNPLLPDTHSEMAVPIILNKQVVGVLDVQEDKVAGFDEGDASVLRSLANQVAVAIRNARLFAEVESSLGEMREAQNRYLEQAWKEVQSMQRSAEFSYRRPDAPILNEVITAQLEQEAATHNQPAVVMVNSKDQEQKEISPAADDLIEQEQTLGVEILDSTMQNAVVAPIKLQNQVIGTIQLHQTDRRRQWTDRDLALIQVITDQVAQTAENLRLIDETRERAGREQTIREITDKLRASPDLGALLETAARELGQRLGVRHTVLELGIGSDEELSDDPSRTSNGKDNSHT